MVFGKSYKEKQEQQQAKLRKLKDKIWFAWYPVKENYGKFVWLQKVKVNWGIYEFNGLLHKSYTRPIYHIIKSDIAF